MIKFFFVLISIVYTQYQSKKELEIIDDFNGDIEFKLGKTN